MSMRVNGDYFSDDIAHSSFYHISFPTLDTSFSYTSRNQSLKHIGLKII